MVSGLWTFKITVDRGHLKFKIMRYIFKFPDIGEGLEEGKIVEWYVEKGQLIDSGDSLVKMETDKVVTDIPSPKTGRIAALYGKAGDTIHVGNPLVEIEMEGVEGEAAVEEEKKPLMESAKLEAIEEVGAAVVGTLEVAGNSAHLPSSVEGMEAKPYTSRPSGKKILATPVARAMAKEKGIDINLVKGTGPAGRVTISDVQKFSDSPQSTVDRPQQTSSSSALQADRLEYKPLTQLRKTIAKNMINSKHNAAHMSLFEEVEISELIRIRNKYKAKFEEKGVKLSYLPFIIKAMTMALKNHKALNAQLDLENERMVYKNYYNVGIAVDTDDGLLVPVIRDADKLSIFEIAQTLNEISVKSRERKLKLEDLKDGTITITNYGSIGGLYAVPVINYPQSAIIGLGRIFKKPIVKDDKVEIGNILPISISVDHRIIDGGEVSRFIMELIDYLSDPISLIMEN